MKRKEAERVSFTCLNCGGEFVLLASQVRVRVKSGTIKYCSHKCFFAAIKKKKVFCMICGVEFFPQRKTSRFCSRKCRSDSRRGKQKTGFWYENGYKVLYAGNGKGIKEHIAIVEEKIGRKLNTNEMVHHKDLKQGNNDPENLVLMTKAAHSRLHRNLEKEKGMKFGRYHKKRMVEELYKPAVIEEV